MITDTILIVAFSLRLAGLTAHGEQYTSLRMQSFQWLSFAAPLIW